MTCVPYVLKGYGVGLTYTCHFIWYTTSKTLLKPISEAPGQHVAEFRVHEDEGVGEVHQHQH